MTEDSLTILLLTNRLCDVKEAKPFTSKKVFELWHKIKKKSPIEKILGCTLVDLEKEYELTNDEALRVRRLCDAQTAFVNRLEGLEESGIKVRSFLDDEFPKRIKESLGLKSPAFLLIAGNTSLLDETARGIVGSRNASKEVINVAQSAANAAVRKNGVVVSGLARGVDRVAMEAALDMDGQVIGVPTEGIREVSKNREIREFVHEDKICLVSPYGPDVGFSVGNAMGRNKIVYAISESTLVVSSDLETGGTWAGAKEALRDKFSQVDVWTGDESGPGNRELVNKLGATGISSRDDFWLSVLISSPKSIEPPREDNPQLKLEVE